MSRSPLKLAVLLSGSGRSLQNLIDLRSAGKLDVDFRAVVASKPGSMGEQRAKAAGLPTHVVCLKDCSDVDEFSRRVFAICDAAGSELVVLAGWLSLLIVPAHYKGRAINIHPSLLPGFGGKGMYGQRVHKAVLDHGCKISGCTVHLVDDSYDTGPIVLQRACPVLEDDDATTLSARVFEEEKIALPEAIRNFAAGRVRVEGRRVHVDRPPDL